MCKYRGQTSCIYPGITSKLIMKICYSLSAKDRKKPHSKSPYHKSNFFKIKIRKIEPARDFIIKEVSSYLGKGTQRHSKFNKCRGCSDFYSVEL